MTVEAVADIRPIRYLRNDPVFFTELLHLQSAQAFRRGAVDRIEPSVFLLELIYLIVDVTQCLQGKLAILRDRFSIVQLLQLVERCDSKATPSSVLTACRSSPPAADDRHKNRPHSMQADWSKPASLQDIHTYGYAADGSSPDTNRAPHGNPFPLPSPLQGSSAGAD